LDAERTIAMLLYRFDSVERYPVFESRTNVRGHVSLHLVSEGAVARLQVEIGRCTDDPPDATVVLALPLAAIGGQPERLELQVVGDGSGCGLFVDATDARACGFTYSLGAVDFTGLGTCSTDMRQPSEWWKRPRNHDTQIVSPPVQLHHLGIAVGGGPTDIGIALVALSVTGDVHLAPPGIAHLGEA
jgi:hypothetical protein